MQTEPNYQKTPSEVHMKKNGATHNIKIKFNLRSCENHSTTRTQKSTQNIFSFQIPEMKKS